MFLNITVPIANGIINILSTALTVLGAIYFDAWRKRKMTQARVNGGLTLDDADSIEKCKGRNPLWMMKFFRRRPGATAALVAAVAIVLLILGLTAPLSGFAVVPEKAGLSVNTSSQYTAYVRVEPFGTYTDGGNVRIVTRGNHNVTQASFVKRRADVQRYRNMAATGISPDGMRVVKVAGVYYACSDGNADAKWCGLSDRGFAIKMNIGCVEDRLGDVASSFGSTGSATQFTLKDGDLFDGGNQRGASFTNSPGFHANFVPHAFVSDKAKGEIEVVFFYMQSAITAENQGDIRRLTCHTKTFTGTGKKFDYPMDEVWAAYTANEDTLGDLALDILSKGGVTSLVAAERAIAYFLATETETYVSEQRSEPRPAERIVDGVRVRLAFLTPLAVILLSICIMSVDILAWQLWLRKQKVYTNALGGSIRIAEIVLSETDSAVRMLMGSVLGRVNACGLSDKDVLALYGKSFIGARIAEADEGYHYEAVCEINGPVLELKEPNVLGTQTGGYLTVE